MNITVHIERLILDGVDLPQGELPAFQTAFEAELTSLLAEGNLSPWLANGGALSNLSGGSFQMESGAPAPLGRQVAGAVYGGLGR